MDFCWDPWQVNVLALCSPASPADAAVPAFSAVPTPGPQSCQPREWIGSPCLSLPCPWLLPKDEWVATVVCRGQGDNSSG